MLMREMEEEIRRQESVIMNNVDVYDDVKITCRPIPKELWMKIPVMKEVTSWKETSCETSSEPSKCSRAGKNRTRAAGEQEQMRREEESFDQLSVMNKPARSKTETRWLSCSLSCCLFFVTTLCATAVSLSTGYFAPSEPSKCSRAGKNRTRAAGEQEQMRREEESFDQLSVMNKPARSKTETRWLSGHVLKVKKSLQCIKRQRTQSTTVSKDFSTATNLCPTGAESLKKYDTQQPLILSILSVDCVEWLNILQQIVQQLFAQLLSFLCHNTLRNSCFFVDLILCAWLSRFATSAFLASGYHVDWICNSTEARDWIHYSSRLVHHLATGCISTAAGCPVVGREMLATGFPNDWLDQTMSYQLIQTTSFAMHPRLIEYNAVALDRMYYSCLLVISSQDHLLNLSLKAKRCPLQLLYRSSSNLRLFSASVPAGPFAPADLSSSAEHDVVTDYIIIDGLLRCSSWFSFDVPAGPSSSLALAAGSYRSSWFNLASA
ncbi:retinoblastoma-related protein [Dorcoceras hygrometricum]|uniref:Retinoblastoma-related protein n=1 Tax=Dorcoceras hygrometricum TaxID=472368 RepID=A0A2Z7AR37_9LAMI|nr:retinoblastoma-related protein [Dorcoceras hygrometricum]